MFNLPRELIKWLQCLDLSKKLQSAKWDLSNGLLIGEIFNKYYPKELHGSLFNNGQSIESKLKNWYLIEVFLKKNKLNINPSLIYGTIYMKEGAAVLLLQQIYQILTCATKSESISGIDLSSFNDSVYQQALPLHARSTAAVTIKNNVSIHELVAEPSLILNKQKAQYLIVNHRSQRQDDRTRFPDRFQVKQKIGQRCIRNAPTDDHTNERDYATTDTSDIKDHQMPSHMGIIRGSDKYEMIKEVCVNQPSKIDVRQ